MIGHLADGIGALDGLGPGTRAEPVERWHLTLCFHGPDSIEDRTRALAGALPGLRAPRLRIGGWGEFRGVLWAGIQYASPADEPALRALAVAAGADPERYTPHLTLLRFAGDRPEMRSLTTRLADYTGPWWTPAEVDLVRSDRTPRGPSYHSVARLALTG
ncbi:MULTISPECIES: 2'-5' RNA ligase family protein [unclassified Crossiella]|uniref:2'-5' RNA ligase family protein n=1 Tax=unclassified Crossiella TaxID=2620835 RepID=UPI001FFF800B|nr:MULTISPECIES: 2'-5' RNA ligase family protein [unclassified Crossiella]MCK2243157.1 2'-5' RNA ligase family protein [Crossiella sp. S99.2]MCK2254374.1 2'-5' RNA ligase family protein [Crossiella sp. S99.1]